MTVVSPETLKAQADPDPARFAAEIDAFVQWDRKNTPPVDAVLFVGSSSIRFWPTAERFPDRVVLNRGFGGAHISDVLYYFDRVVAPYAPRAVVFYAGDNDVNDGKTPERVRDDYRAFVERVWSVSPGTPVLYIPIKPSLARWAIWPAMQRANDLVRTFTSTQDDLYYADIATPMLGADGTPRPELFVEDGLHLSAEGYDLWTGIVAAVLNRVIR